MSQTTYTLTTGDVARRYAVSEETVRRWARAGRIPSRELPSGQLRFSEADLARVDDSQPTQ